MTQPITDKLLPVGLLDHFVCHLQNYFNFCNSYFFFVVEQFSYVLLPLQRKERKQYISNKLKHVDLIVKCVRKIIKLSPK